jgi:hypothetical protein
MRREKRIEVETVYYKLMTVKVLPYASVSMQKNKNTPPHNICLSDHHHQVNAEILISITKKCRSANRSL